MKTGNAWIRSSKIIDGKNKMLRVGYSIPVNVKHISRSDINGCHVNLVCVNRGYSKTDCFIPLLEVPIAVGVPRLFNDLLIKP